MAPEPTLTIYTIGHSHQSEAGFVDLLRRHQIELVVDVRSAPYSRFTPQFNRDNLRLLLTEAGLRYAFAGDKLGGRPADPGCYRRGVVPPPGADFLHEVDYVAVEQRPWYQDGLRRLTALAHDHRTAMMCSEENPFVCHRHHLIARTLLNQGLLVLHIRHEGDPVAATVARQQTDLFGALEATE